MAKLHESHFPIQSMVGPEPKKRTPPPPAGTDATTATPVPSLQPDGPPPAAPADTRWAVEMTCILEATARKPGNVHPTGDRADGSLRYTQFLAAAIAVGPALASAPQVGIGAAVLAAVRASWQHAPTNTNLGICLLLAPLCAVADSVGGAADQVAVRLAATTVADTMAVYDAIRLAQPGGLGRVPQQDVRAEPTVPLLEAMRLAAQRDAIAAEYATGFRGIRAFGAARLRDALGHGLSLEDAIVWCHLCWLARQPDSLIARKFGPTAAGEVQRRAATSMDTLVGRLGDFSSSQNLADAPGVVDLDTTLRRNGWNPGTSADLVAASLFWALRFEGLDVTRYPFSTTGNATAS